MFSQLWNLGRDMGYTAAKGYVVAETGAIFFS